MKKEFSSLSGNVNTATLKVKTLNGKSYLVGPVIMAKEIVMNKLLYPASDLKASVMHWNGCPLVVNHPKDSDGNFISANSPDVLEEVGIGMVFNTKFDAKKRLCSEAWLDVELLEKHEDVKAIIEAGDMLEVSTGLFTYHEQKSGKFDGREYSAIARNHKPDHLALLPNETGACSIEDGAGFPRVNETVEVNALCGGDLYALLGKAVRVKMSMNGYSAYMSEVIADDKTLIFERYNATSNSYDLYKVAYTLSADEMSVTFADKITKVQLRKSYVDEVEEDVIQQNQTAGDSKVSPDSNNGEHTMKKQDIIAKMLADKKIDANVSKVLEGMTDEQFDVYQKAVPTVPHNPKATLAGSEADTNELDKETDDETEVEGNKKPEVPAVNAEDAETLKWAKAKLATEKEVCITKILANANNKFVKEDLEVMSINALEKIASIATVPATDMAGVGAKVDKPAPDANKKSEVTKVQAYVPAE
jgi:hypothetical protein